MAVAALAVGLGACSGDGSRAENAGSAPAADSAAPGYTVSEEALTEAPAAEAPVLGGETAVAADREIITTGSAHLVVDDPVAAAAQVVALVERAGGHVEARNEWRGPDGERSSAWLRLRIPAANMTATVDALSDVGTVQSVDLSREDVTATGRDLDARIAALTTSTDRLTELLARAENVEDLLGIERELSSRQAELDGLRAQRAALSEQVAMSTLHVSLDTRVTAGVAPTGFAGGLSAGWGALATAGRGTLVVLGAMLPWLAVGGVVAVGALAVVRHLRRRRAASTGAPTATPTTAATTEDAAQAAPRKDGHLR